MYKFNNKAPTQYLKWLHEVWKSLWYHSNKIRPSCCKSSIKHGNTITFLLRLPRDVLHLGRENESSTLSLQKGDIGSKQIATSCMVHLNRTIDITSCCDDVLLFAEIKCSDSFVDSKHSLVTFKSSLYLHISYWWDVCWLAAHISKRHLFQWSLNVSAASRLTWRKNTHTNTKQWHKVSFFRIISGKTPKS